MYHWKIPFYVNIFEVPIQIAYLNILLFSIKFGVFFFNILDTLLNPEW